MNDDADRKLREPSVPCIRRVTTVRLRMLPVRGACPYGKNSPFVTGCADGPHCYRRADQGVEKAVVDV